MDSTPLGMDGTTFPHEENDLQENGDGKTGTGSDAARVLDECFQVEAVAIRACVGDAKVNVQTPMMFRIGKAAEAHIENLHIRQNGNLSEDEDQDEFVPMDIEGLEVDDNEPDLPLVTEESFSTDSPKCKGQIVPKVAGASSFYFPQSAPQGSPSKGDHGASFLTSNLENKDDEVHAGGAEAEADTKTAHTAAADQTGPAVRGRESDEAGDQVLRVFGSAGAWHVEESAVDLDAGDCIGEGTISFVFGGRWAGRPVAVKMLKLPDPSAPHLPPFAIDLANELCWLSQVRHPNIVTFLGAGTRTVAGREFPMVVYERLRGSVLDVGEAEAAARGRREWVPGAGLALGWGCQLLRALHFLHALLPRPLAHRDVRPANLLVAPDLGTLKLGDLSLATPLAGHGPPTHFAAGSLRFLAPEVRGGAACALDKADVYAAALCVWSLLHGQRPFPSVDDSTHVIELARRGRRPAVAAKHRAAAPLFAAAWHPDPAQRPPAGDLAEALGELWTKAEAEAEAEAGRGSVASPVSAGGGKGMLARIKSFRSSFKRGGR